MNLPAEVRARRSYKAGLRLLGVLLLAVVSAATLPEANATTNLVYTLNDTGAGSLRQVIQNSSPSDTIIFSNIVTGTITLTSGELLIDKSLSILGPGTKVLAVSGNTNSRVFQVAAGVVTISGLMLRDGKYLGATITNQGQDGFGGGIYCAQLATLTVSDCVVSNCFAIGGNGGESPGSGQYGGWGGWAYGGGVCSDGVLTLERCWLVGNRVIGGTGGDGGLNGYGGMGGYGSGGGLCNRSNNMTVRGCTLSANQAILGHEGGGTSPGLSGSASAGGLYNLAGAATLINCTVSGNAVDGILGFGTGGAIVSSPRYAPSATLVLVSCTVADNFSDGSNGGVANSGGTCYVTNSIIARNVAGSASDVGGAFISGGYNLIGYQADAGTGFVDGVDHDQAGTITPLDPMLSPLGDFGGPTPTHALLSGSPAIDQGKSFGLATDQRGAPRPFDFASIPNAGGSDGSDIGAFESGSAQLDLRKHGINAVLSWPSYYGGFSLEFSTNAALPNGWTLAGGSAVVVGNQYQQTNGPISGDRFFRLRGN